MNSNLELKKLKQPIGLVLCGGKSERMKADKGLINYHGVPQWQYVYQFLRPLCQDVYLSLNEQQASEWALPSFVNISIDKEQFKNHGPMTAVLSIIDTLKEQPLFMVACDYPFLEDKHLIQLINARAADADITCLLKAGRPEPMISIFETNALNKLTSFFEDGNDSIFKFIEENKYNACLMEDTKFLLNVNSQEAMEAIQKTLNS